MVIRCTHCGSYEYKKMENIKVLKDLYVKTVKEFIAIKLENSHMKIKKNSYNII